MKIVRSFLKLRIVGRHQNGFTFNEVLVAINVIVIAVLGYSLSTVGVIRGNLTNDNTTVGDQLGARQDGAAKGAKKSSQ